jgi:transcriptional regulator with XRE-family HTH domain
MKFSEAFDKTLKQFSLTGKALALQSGVTEASISRFRRGERDIQAENLERLINALPIEAQEYFYFNCLVSNLDDRGIATLLQVISQKLHTSTVDRVNASA